MDESILGGMGWTRDLPDVRDYRLDTPEIEALLASSKAFGKAGKGVAAAVDLRAACSPIEDQGSLGSCTANAGVGLLEYFERRAHGKYLDGSRSFLYKATRNLLGWKGDHGAYLRTTMKAMALFGVPPEAIRPYDAATFDDEPPAFCYAFAQNFKAIRYYRLDPAGTPGTDVLTAVKRNLAAGLPSMFGFTVYSSMPGIGQGSGDIPYPRPGDAVKGGHAVVAVGYDDAHTIGDEEGALLIRNSWGVGWGEKGYGWLPYRYLVEQVAVDFWSLVQADFVDTELFR
jgi:C1A family cysteine protease